MNGLTIEFNEKLAFLFEPARLKIGYGGRGAGIYCILNTINGKLYVGSAKNFYKRWYLHKYKLNRNFHDNKHLQSAWTTYGESSFEFIILEATNADRKELEVREQFWIDLTNCFDRKIGYNLSPTANSQLGVIRSNETKLKISAAKTGIKLNFSEAHKAALSKAAKGKIKSKEHLAKLKSSIIARCRDISKWPHEKGNRCTCKECTEKKRILQIARRRSKNGN